MRNLSPYLGQRNFTTDLFSEMDRFFDTFNRASAWTEAEKSRSFAYDLEETDDHYELSVDLPGVKKEEIKIELHENILTISGERKRNDKVTGTFNRSFSLPATVDADKVEAQYENGVLELRLPKAASAKPRQIEIQSSKPGFFDRLIDSRKTDQTKNSEKAETAKH